MSWTMVLLLVFAILAGAAQPFQFNVNSQLRSWVGSPVTAAAISFFVGLICLTILSFFNGFFSQAKPLTQAPWWIWTGGLLGAFYVFSTIILTPRLGAAATVSFLLAGQLIAAMVMDHYGLLSLPVHEINLPRLVGAALIIAGIFLVQKF
ncbi:DMT family transporter [Aureibacillus halotolerans]|uniref:Transporter family-2 protein n=1 Tax=Aureibacillus halotolerans TaxID=1508390 RepID=A0A4R6U877_9BACI|nr:DMT family transporter [Aureibacillus halotolerans]TDQ42770.1 transporter family-2 protein [Aureibacillus halotolerans]